MCTASWLIREQGFELFFNRDESLRRGAARPPELSRAGELCVLAPVDSDAGGTWLGVNERGLALGLLNGRDGEPAVAEPRSRGILVRTLLRASGFEELESLLQRADLARLRPFTLAAFLPGGEPRVFRFAGGELARQPAQLPLCSSSLDGERACLERTRLLERLGREHGPLDAELLERFQRSHEPERGPWSPCMHRSDARTVSASHVRVDASSVAIRYAPGAPCENSFGPWLVLSRDRG